MRKPSAIHSVLTLTLFLSAILLKPESAAGQGYPEISELKSRNFLFEQYQQDVQNAGKSRFRGIEPDPQFYSYIPKDDDTIISVAARCSIRQDSLATINSIQESGQKITGRKIILPVCDGLYIPVIPENSFEILLANENKEKTSLKETVTFTLDGRSFYYIPEGKLSPSLRAYFLNPGMSMPLEKSTLTSAYGMRVSPVSGKWKMHRGIDLAAPRGSKILACREGFVKQAVTGNPVFGNYVIIRHPNGMESLYAHMDQINVEKNQKVVTGQSLGTVGMTGLTTGPHLHFEISQNGSSLNPENYLRN